MVTILSQDTLACNKVSNSPATISVVFSSTASALQRQAPITPAAVLRCYAEPHATSYSTLAAMQHPMGYMSALHALPLISVPAAAEL